MSERNTPGGMWKREAVRKVTFPLEPRVEDEAERLVAQVKARYHLKKVRQDGEESEGRA